ncbi:MAG: hypothetical protein ABSF59_18475 [Candidatus Sulfotelmatobacter sp.]|jgi:hypothetical protein
MKKHPYLRAYMAGIFVPTLGLLAALAVFILTRLVFRVPVPLERSLIFPMALAPNLFGLWNVLYVWSGRRWPIGLHGAVLPLIMAPIGVLVAELVGILSFGAHSVTFFQQVTVPYAQIIPEVIGQDCAITVVYYLIWKYIIGALNRTLEI